MTKTQKHLINTLIDELKSAKSQSEIETAIRYFWHIWYALMKEENNND